MAFISKNPTKAKYRIDSTKLDGTRMHERCDNKEQVRAYIQKIVKQDRSDIVLWTNTPLTSLKRSH